MSKPRLNFILDKETGKLVVDADCFIAVNNGNFVVVPTLTKAEEFGGKIYCISHHIHISGDGEEELPQSYFLKEV